VFSDVERRELKLARDPVSAFLNGWTRKEAYVKALGMGLTAPLREITVSLSDRAALFSAGLRDQSASYWRLLSVRIHALWWPSRSARQRHDDVMVATEGELPGLNPAVNCQQMRHSSTTMNGPLHRRNPE